jgi:hypothetical protein
MPLVRSDTVTRQVTDWSRGINRTADRFALQDNEAWWLENLQPIGPGTLRAVPGPAAVLVTLPVAVASLWGVVLNNTRRLIAVGTDGSLRAINPGTGAVIVIQAAGTFSSSARLSVWQDQLLLIADPTGGYASWDGTTLVRYPHTRTGNTTSGSAVITGISPNTTGLRPGIGVSGSGIPAGARILTVDSATQITLDLNATATATGVTLTFGAGAPTAANDLAVFEGRVWLQTGTRGFTVSAPNSWADFALVNAAVTFTLTDSAFPGAVTRVLSSLQALWIFGPAAVSTVTNVRTGGTPTTTLFSVTNVVSGLGVPTTAWASVTPFFRSILFLTEHGAHAIVGATPQKISERIDRLVAGIDFNQQVVGATGTIQSIYSWVLRIRWLDPDGPPADKLLVFSRGVWWVADVGSVDWIAALPRLDTGEIEVWAAAGAAIRRLFVSGATAGELRTKLWDFGNFPQGKRMLRLAVMGQSEAGAVPMTVQVENENGVTASTSTTFASLVTWTDSTTNQLVTWTDSTTGQDVTWTRGGLSSTVLTLPASGNWLGVRVQATAERWTLGGMSLEIEPLGEWVMGTS